MCKPLLAGLIACLPLNAMAHDGHEHATHDTPAPSASDSTGVTGSGDLRFRYNAELSELPAEIAAGIKPAHGGFAKTPSGEIYFGLEGTGVIRLSADLKEKTLVSTAPAIRVGGLHNTTYVDRDGGLLVLPDNGLGQVHVLSLDGEEVATLGRPDVNDYYADESNAYHPTDTDIDANGTLYVCDGYSPAKAILTADLGSMTYGEKHFGGPVPDGGRTEGKFSTNHGVTFDPTDGTLVVADRERQWAQKLTTDGEFVEGFDTAGANPCDVDFVEWGGERLMVVGCLVSAEGPGVVQVLRGGEVVSTLRPKLDLGLQDFQHIHNAVGVVVEGKLYVLCYGWNPGCYAVLEHVAD